MPALNSKKATNKVATTSVSTIQVHRKTKAVNIPMLTSDLVPRGTYRSKILSVEDAVCANGAPAADVVYRFVSDSGFSAEAKIRYPLEGYHIGQLFDALLDAGLPEGSSIVDAVGIQEEVTVAYPYEGSLGKIQTRRPLSTAGYSQGVNKKRPSLAPVSTRAVPPKNSNHDDEDDEDEFDDFIEDDEELDDA